MSEQRLVQLGPVDARDVTIVVDNAIDDLAASTDLAQRQPNPPDYFEREHLRAEHGYSLWMTVTRDGRRDTLLYHAGLSRAIAVHKLRVLDYTLKDVRTAVFSWSRRPSLWAGGSHASPSTTRLAAGAPPRRVA